MNGTWGELWAAILPPLGTLIATGLGALIVAAVQRIGGNIMQQSDREALHSALNTGVRAALQRLGPGATLKDVIADAAAYAQKSVPDALRRLNPSDDVKARIATSKVQEATAEPCPPGQSRSSS